MGTKKATVGLTLAGTATVCSAAASVLFNRGRLNPWALGAIGLSLASIVTAYKGMSYFTPRSEILAIQQELNLIIANANISHAVYFQKIPDYVFENAWFISNAFDILPKQALAISFHCDLTGEKIPGVSENEWKKLFPKLEVYAGTREERIFEMKKLAKTLFRVEEASTPKAGELKVIIEPTSLSVVLPQVPTQSPTQDQVSAETNSGNSLTPINTTSDQRERGFFSNDFNNSVVATEKKKIVVNCHYVKLFFIL